eukprot:ANDGO_05459.mRNA.1 Vacuolar protein 8
MGQGNVKNAKVEQDKLPEAEEDAKSLVSSSSPKSEMSPKTTTTATMPLSTSTSTTMILVSPSPSMQSDLKKQHSSLFELPPSPKKKKGSPKMLKKSSPGGSGASPVTSPKSSLNTAREHVDEEEKKKEKSKHEMARDDFFDHFRKHVQVCFKGNREQQLSVALLFEEVLCDADCQFFLSEKENGLDALFSLFRADDEKILEHSSRCIAYLATVGDDVRRTMALRDVLDRSVRFLGHKNWKISMNCVAAVCNISYETKLAESIVDNYEVCPTIVGLLKHKRLDVIQQAARCCAQIASNGKYYRDMLLSLKIVPILIAGLTIKDSRTLFQICRVIGELTKDVEVAAGFIKKGVLPRLLDIVAHDQEMPRLEASKIIANMSEIDAEKKEIFEAAEESLINAAQFASLDVKIHALRALANLSENDEVRTSEDIEQQEEEEQHFRAELNNILRDFVQRLVTDPIFAVFMHCSEEEQTPEVFASLGYRPFVAPIDLQIIKKRVEEWYYTNLVSFKADVLLIVDTVKATTNASSDDPYSLFAKMEALQFLVEEMVKKVEMEQPLLVRITNAYKSRLQVRRSLEHARMSIIAGGAVSLIPFFISSDNDLLFHLSRLMANCVVPQYNQQRIIRDGELEPVNHVLRFHDDEQTLTEILRFLGNLAQLDEAKIRYPKLGFLEEIIKFARSESQLLQRFSMRCLATMSTLQASRVHIRDAGGLQIIANCVCFGSPEVRTEAIKAMAWMVEDEPSRQLVFESGAFNVVLIVVASAKGPERSLHTWQACRLLSQMAASPKCRSTMVLMGAIPVVLKTCEEFMGRNPVHGYDCSVCQKPFESVRYACLFLYFLSQEDSLLSDLQVCGTHRIMLQLAVESTDAWIRQYSMACLANVLAKQDVQDWFYEEEAFVRILDFAQDENEDIIGTSIGVLASCAMHESMRETIVENGIIERCVEILKDKAISDGIGEADAIAKSEACRLLGNVCSEAEYAECADDLQACEELVRLISQSDDQQVQKNAARAIESLTADSDYFRLKFAQELDAIVPLIALASSPFPFVQQHAVGSISNIALEPENKSLVVDSGAVAALVHLTLSKHASVQSRAAEALGRLAEESENRDIIADEEAIRPLVNLLRSSDSTVREKSIEALLNLGQKNAENQYGMYMEGALDRALALLQDANESTKSLAYDLVSRMAENDMIKGLLLEKGAYEPIILMAQAPAVEPRRHCSSILLRLADDDNHRENLLRHDIGRIVQELGICQDVIIAGNGIKLMQSFCLDDAVLSKYILTPFTAEMSSSLLEVRKLEKKRPWKAQLFLGPQRSQSQRDSIGGRRRSTCHDVVETESAQLRVSRDSIPVPEGYGHLIFCQWIYCCVSYIGSRTANLQRQSLILLSVLCATLEPHHADFLAAERSLDCIGRLLHCVRSLDAGTKALALNVLSKLTAVSNVARTKAATHRRFKHVIRSLSLYDKLLRVSSPAKIWVDWDACRLLANCAALPSLQKLLYGNTEILLSITRLLRNTNVSVRVEALRCIANLSQDKNNKVHIGSNRSLVHSILKHLTSEYVTLQQFAVEALAHLVVASENIDRLMMVSKEIFQSSETGQAATSDPLVNVLQQLCHSRDEEVVRHSIRALASLTTRVAFKRSLYLKEMIESVILDLMYSQNVEIIQSATKCMGNVAMNEQIKSVVVLDTKLLQKIVAGLMHVAVSRPSLDSVAEVSRAIAYLATDRPFVDCLLRNEGMETVVSMIQCPVTSFAGIIQTEVATCIQIAADALRASATFLDSHGDAKAAWLKYGGLENTCVVTTQSADMILQYWSCRSLQTLSHTKDERHTIVHAGGYRLFAALCRTSYDEVILFSTSMVIEFMENINEIREFHMSGGTEALALFLMTDKVEICDSVVKAITILAEDQETVESFLGLEIVSSCVALLDSKSFLIRQNCMKILADCSLNGTCEESVVSLGTLNRCMEALEPSSDIRHFISLGSRHPSVLFLRESLRALCNLAFRTDAQQGLFRSGIVGRLLGLLSVDPQTVPSSFTETLVDLQKFTMITLAYISFEQSFRPQIASLALMAIRRMMDHPEPLVGAYAASIMGNIVEEAALMKYVQTCRPLVASVKKLLLAPKSEAVGSELDVVDLTAKAFANMSGSMDLEEEVSKVHIIPTIIRLLPEVPEWFLNSHRKQPEKKLSFHECFPEVNEEKVEDLCRCIANICVLKTENKLECVAQGGHKRLLFIVSVLQEDLAVTLQAARALGFISEDEKNAKEISNFGGVAAMACLMNNNSVRELRLLSLRTLAPIAFIPEQREVILQHIDSFSFVIRSIKEKDEETAFWSLKFLKNILHHEAAVERMLADGALQSLMLIFSDMARSIRCVQTAIDVLHEHRENEDIQVIMLQEREAQALLPHTASSFLSVQSKVIEIFVSLSKNSRNHRSLLESQAIHRLVSFVYSPVHLHFELALQFVFNIVGEESNAEWAPNLMNRLGLLPFLVDLMLALKRSGKEVFTHKLAYEILKKISVSEEVCYAVLEAGGTEAVDFLDIKISEDPVPLPRLIDGEIHSSSLQHFKYAVKRVIMWNRMRAAEGPLYPPACVVSGGGLAGGEAGTPVVIFVSSRDRFERRRKDTSRGLFTVAAVNERTKETIQFSETVVRNIYQFSSDQFTLVGRYLLSVTTASGEHVDQSPYILEIAPGNVHHPLCVVHKDDLQHGFIRAGQKSNFRIEAKDAFGNRILGGGLGIEVRMVYFGSQTSRLRKGVQIVDESVAWCKVNDPDDGFLEGSLWTKSAGFYELRISLHGAEMHGSPLIFEVYPAGVDPTKSSFNFSGTSSCPAGWLSQGRVITRDAHGNELLKGGLTVRSFASAENGASEEFPVEDLQDGAYIVSIRPSISGKLRISVVVDGQEIIGSGFTMQVYSGPPHIQSFRAVGYGTRKARVGIRNRFLVQARDRFGNDLHSSFLPLTVEIRDASTNVTEDVGVVKTGGDGKYRVEYEVTVVKPFHIYILSDGIPTAESPLKISGVIY